MMRPTWLPMPHDDAPSAAGHFELPVRRAPDRADRRRRAGRGRVLGGDRRPHGEPARRGHVGRGPQPPVARPRGARHRGRPPARHVRGGRLALRDGEVRRPPAGPARAARPHRRDAQRGGDRRRLPATAARRPDVAIAVMGALVPEAVEAVDALAAEAGIAAGGRVRHERRPPVPLLPGPRGARRRRSARSPGCSRTTSPSSPLLDGHPHALAFLGGRVTCPGVQRFGQSGDLRELYEHREIDAESVIGAALDLRGG